MVLPPAVLGVDGESGTDVPDHASEVTIQRSQPDTQSSSLQAPQ